MRGPVLVDTGPIVAILSSPDQHHRECVDALSRIRGPLLTCWPVITEAAWLLRNYGDAVTRLLGAFTGGTFELIPLTVSDLPTISVLLSKHKTLGLQLADASLAHLAAREKINSIFTLDRRDFGVLRAGDGKKLRLIP